MWGKHLLNTTHHLYADINLPLESKSHVLKESSPGTTVHACDSSPERPTQEGDQKLVAACPTERLPGLPGLQQDLSQVNFH